MEKPLKKNAKIDEFGLDSKLVGFLHLAAALEDGFLGFLQHETADVAVLVYCLNVQRRYCKPVVLHIREYPFLDTSDCITFDPFAQNQ